MHRHQQAPLPNTVCLGPLLLKHQRYCCACVLRTCTHVLLLCRAVGEQLLVVLCSLSNMLAEQDTELLEQLHAGTLDLLLGECVCSPLV